MNTPFYSSPPNLLFHFEQIAHWHIELTKSSENQKLITIKLTTNETGEEHTTLKEEKLTQLIRKIFQEEFKKQEVHITNIISSNFKITMEEIKKSQEQIKELKKEVTDLKSSIEHTGADLNDLNDRVDEIYDYQVDP